MDIRSIIPQFFCPLPSAKIDKASQLVIRHLKVLRYPLLLDRKVPLTGNGGVRDVRWEGEDIIITHQWPWLALDGSHLFTLAEIS